MGPIDHKESCYEIFVTQLPEIQKLHQFFDLDASKVETTPTQVLEAIKIKFYDFIKSDQELAGYFQSPEALLRISKRFVPFLANIIEMPMDERYIRNCFQVGYVHYKVNLPPYAFTAGLWKIVAHLEDLGIRVSQIKKIMHIVNHLVSSAFETCKQYEANLKVKQQRVFSQSILHDLSGSLNNLNFRYEKLLIELKKSSLSLDFSLKVLNDAKSVFSALESQSTIPDSKDDNVNICQLIPEIIESFQPAIKEKNLDIITNLQQVYCVVLRTNKYRLTKILINLLSNATRFTENSGVISIKLKREKLWLVLEISDNGLGIAKSLMQRAFSIESSVSTVDTEGVKSSGFGLSIVVSFLTSLGYDYTIVSVPKGCEDKHEHEGHGTTITIRIPTEDITEMTMADVDQSPSVA